MARLVLVGLRSRKKAAESPKSPDVSAPVDGSRVGPERSCEQNGQQTGGQGRCRVLGSPRAGPQRMRVRDLAAAVPGGEQGSRRSSQASLDRQVDGDPGGGPARVWPGGVAFLGGVLLSLGQDMCPRSGGCCSSHSL
jgi:hypothetical protein